MRHAIIEIIKVRQINGTLIAVCFSDGTESDYTVEQLLAYKPKRFSATADPSSPPASRSVG